MNKGRMQQLAGLASTHPDAGDAWMSNRKAKILAIRNDNGTNEIVFLPFDKYNATFGTNHTNKSIDATPIIRGIAQQAIEVGTALLPEDQVDNWTRLVNKLNMYLMRAIPKDQYTNGEVYVVGVLMR
jgi:hypothetical protein